MEETKILSLDAVEEIRSKKNTYWFNISDVVSDAFDALCDSENALIQRVRDLEAERAWISVSERLPEEDLDVLSLWFNRHQEVLRREDGKWLDSEGIRVCNETVTHWQRLPPTNTPQ